MKVLITGSEGFYGKHLCAEFEANGYEVIRCDLKVDEGVVSLDITNTDNVLDVISQYKPDVLVNMAGQANVGLSWEKPQLTFNHNTIGLINVLEAVKIVSPQMRVIAIGSSDEYGNLKERGVNVVESMPISPMTPYAISKQAQEEFAQLYNKNFGMNVCLIRQFNLGGFGQAKGFMISDFASGIVEIERGHKEYLSVGNLESARDFTHVKDACKAIRLIAEKGHAGEVYNICSAITYTAQEVLDKLIGMSKATIKVRQNPSKMRPSDTPVICGNYNKLSKDTGWFPSLSIDDILQDELDYWRKQ